METVVERPAALDVRFVPWNKIHILCPSRLCGRQFLGVVITVIGIVVASRVGT
jgi:hypothetical protein